MDGVGQAGDTNSDLYATVGDKVVQQRAMPGREYSELYKLILVGAFGERNRSFLPKEISLFSEISSSLLLLLVLCYCSMPEGGIV